MTELKTCPYCNGIPKIATRKGKFKIVCDGDCWTSTDWYWSFGEAIEKWNSLEKKEHNELERCPFCGGEAYTVENFEGLWSAYCEDCGAESDGYETEYEAIEAWNRRTKE